MPAFDEAFSAVPFDEVDGTAATPAAPLPVPPDRVAPRLAAILRERAAPDDPAYEPRALSREQLGALRAMLDRVIPQDEGEAIDLAARLDAMMADASGNGWRYEALPTDPEAYCFGLDTLDDLARAEGAARFAGLTEDERDAILVRMAAGEAGVSARNRLDAGQMRLWFEEVRSDAVRLFVAHPRTMARIGYGGIGNGAAGGAAFAGFRAIGIGEREPFEPTLAREDAARGAGAAS